MNILRGSARARQVMAWLGGALLCVAGTVAQANSVGATSNRGMFLEPLVATGTVTRADRAGLDIAIERYRRDVAQAVGDLDAYARVEPLVEYLRSHPTSPWRVSLLTNIALRYEQLGYVQRALDFDAQAVAAGAAASGAVGAEADAALADELELHAWLGHAEETKALLANPRVAMLQGGAHLKAVDARLALQTLQSDPGQAMRCGWVALEHLMRLRGASAPQLAALSAMRSGSHGTSLAQLAAWADEQHAGLKTVHVASVRDMPLPAVVHMKTDHFAMLAAARGLGASRQYRLVDPVLGDDRWVSGKALAAEMSGYALVDATEPMRRASTDEAARVMGAGNPTKKFSGATSGTQDNQSGGDCTGPSAGSSGFSGSSETKGSEQPSGSADGSACDACTAPCAKAPGGMPDYAVQSLNIGLTLHDMPFTRATAVGPAVTFSVYYSQNEANQPAVFTFSNLGQKWTHNWLAYVTDDPTQVGQNVGLYKRTGGFVNYTGYNAADGTFTREARSEQLVLASTSPVKYVRHFADGSQEVYTSSDGTSAAGRRVFLTKVMDAAGNAVVLGYDSQMRLSTITDASSVVTTVGYQTPTSLLISSVSDGLGRHADFGYDANGRLQSISDTLQMSSSFGYDGNGNVNSMTTPYGQTLFNSVIVSPLNRYIEITDPLGKTERVEYESTGGNGITGPAATPKGMNVATFDVNLRDTFYFDKVAYVAAKRADGTFDYTQATVMKHWAETQPGNAVVAPVLLATRHPMNGNTEWEWYLYPDMIGADGNYSPKTVTDIWTMTSSGRVLPDNTSRVTQVTYNTQGQITTMIDPLNRTTTYQYDTNGIDLLKITQSDTAGHSEVVYQASNYTSGHLPQTVIDAAGQTTNYTYNGLGQLVTVTDPLHELTTYNYNAQHQLINIVNADTIKQIKFGYDTFGRVQTVTDSEGYTKTFGYDNLNRVTSVTYPDNTSDVTNYDRMDVGSTVDRLLHKTTFTHDAQRRLKKVLDANSNTTFYDWYDNDRLHTFTDGNSHVTTWTIDAEGRVQQKAYPSGQGYTIAYDSAGRESTRTDTNGHVRTIGYNKDDTVASLGYTGGTTDTQNFFYETMYPRLLSMLDKQTTVTTTFAYVPAGTKGAGQLKSEVSSQTSNPVSYTYDELGRQKTRTVNGSTETWTYDAIGRVQSDANALGSFTYTYLGETAQPQTEVLAGGKVQTKWQWNTNVNDRMLVSITHPSAPGAAAAASGMGWFERLETMLGLTIAHPVAPHAVVLANAAGINYTTQTGMFTGRSSGADSWTYGYDKTNRLKSAAYGGTGAGQGGQYTYDAADNLTKIATTNPASTENYVPNADNQVASTTGAIAASWIYDQNGNVTDDGVNTYAWDVENRPVKITNKSTGHVSSFNYDGLGRRISIGERDSGGGTTTTWFAWCQGVATPCGSTTGSNASNYFSQGEYNPGASPVYLYYARDHLGSVMQTMDASGNTVYTRTYGEYGKTYNTSGSANAVPTMGYAGMYQHSQSGLYFTLNRIYDARDGRWLSRDPSEEDGGSNLYGYAGAAPNQYTDPLGLSKLTVKYFNGSSRVIENPSAQDLITTLNSSADHSISLLQIFGHGGPFEICISGGNNCVDTLTSNLNVVSGGNQVANIQPSLAQKLGVGAQVRLEGCNSASGDFNMSRSISESLTNVPVTGGWGYQLGYENHPIFGNSSGSFGFKRTYLNGKLQ